ncbi:MAG: hypothetical protein ACJ74U_06710 [Jatrophihabitantaceae bacterium]
MATFDSADEDVVRLDLLRSTHDPKRPAVDTGEAAAALGISRQAVVQGIQRGSIEGYGIPGAARTRWFVYRGALQQRLDADTDLNELRRQLAESQAARQLLEQQVIQGRKIIIHLRQQVRMFTEQLTELNETAIASAFVDLPHVAQGTELTEGLP